MAFFRLLLLNPKPIEFQIQNGADSEYGHKIFAPVPVAAFIPEFVPIEIVQLRPADARQRPTHLSFDKDHVGCAEVRSARRPALAKAAVCSTVLSLVLRKSHPLANIFRRTPRDLPESRLNELERISAELNRDSPAGLDS